MVQTAKYTQWGWRGDNWESRWLCSNYVSKPPTGTLNVNIFTYMENLESAIQHSAFLGCFRKLDPGAINLYYGLSNDSAYCLLPSLASQVDPFPRNESLEREISSSQPTNNLAPEAAPRLFLRFPGRRLRGAGYGLKFMGRRGE